MVIWVPTFERFRREVMGSRLLLVEGVVQKSLENVIQASWADVLEQLVPFDAILRQDPAGVYAALPKIAGQRRSPRAERASACSRAIVSARPPSKSGSAAGHRTSRAR